MDRIRRHKHAFLAHQRGCRFSPSSGFDIEKLVGMYSLRVGFFKTRQEKSTDRYIHGIWYECSHDDDHQPQGLFVV
jgi:hypothetical protein